MATKTPLSGMKKAGVGIAASVGVLLSAGLATLLLGHRAFTRLVRRDEAALLVQSRAEPEKIVTEAMLAGLPDPIRRYLSYTGIVGKPLVHTVQLKQRGKIRGSAEQPWMDLDAEQQYIVRPPGFVWYGTMRLGPVPLVCARDRYADGRGNMLIRAGGIYPIADARGEEMDQGAMMRYLSEMIWFPAAFLGDNISFAPIDDRSARVTLTDHGRSVSGTLYVDQEGRLTDFVAQRYRMVDGGYALATWSTPVAEYGALAGLRLPVRGQAVWKLPEGDLAYIDVAITELAYNFA